MLELCSNQVSVEETLDEKKEASDAEAFLNEVGHCLEQGVLTQEAWQAHLAGGSWQIHVR